jgi:hypothetical protein
VRLPCRPCVGAKRGRDRLGLEIVLEESATEEGTVACGAVEPLLDYRGELSRRVTKPSGSSLSGLSEQSDQDMAAPVASTEGALSFGKAAEFTFPFDVCCVAQPGLAEES